MKTFLRAAAAVVLPMNNACPATMVPTMPFLFRSTEHMRKVLPNAILK